jgi:hypothetical protein
MAEEQQIEEQNAQDVGDAKPEGQADEGQASAEESMGAQPQDEAEGGQVPA